MLAIETSGLTRRFGSVTALADLSVGMPTGVVGLVGANGAGKSTLIKILLGLLPASEGTATVLGHNCATDGLAIRHKVGYMPESECLPTDVSATDFLVHMARMSGLPTDIARERAADTLRHVGLFEERYRAIGGYSTGMKQRVKLAQSLVHDPDLVLLDEPTNGLDPAGRDEMLDLINRISHEFGINVLVTSHLLGELERISDHIVLIEQGRLRESTSTADATTQSGSLVVEVTEKAEAIVAALAKKKIEARLDDHDTFVVAVNGDSVHDAVVDAVAAAKAGLVRMSPSRHRLAEFFQEDSNA